MGYAYVGRMMGRADGIENVLNDSEEVGVPPSTLFVPCYVILIALSLYGPIEYMYMSHLCAESDLLHVLTCVALNIAFLACVVIGWVYMLSKAVINTFPRLAVCVAPLAVFLGCYAVAAEIVDLEHVEVLRIPNVAPWLFTWVGCRDCVPLDAYHLILFGVGFLSLVTALVVPTWISFRAVKASAAVTVACLGALIIGLSYQDWLWFVSSPTAHLTCGSRYGVFFNQWICLGSVGVPAMYVVAHAIGLPMIVVPSLRVCRGRIAPYVAGLLGIMAVVISAGVITTLLLK